MEQSTIIQPVVYLPVDQRLPSMEYRNLLETIMRYGEEKFSPWHKQKKRRIRGHVLRFDMRNGFPIITERKVGENLFRGALGEHIAFLNGAHTLDQLEQYGCPRNFWERWVTKEKCDGFGLPPGDLGPGSYGPAWRNFPASDGMPFDQIENIQRQVREFPNIRTHFITPWIPYYTCSGNSDFPRRVVVAPCHGSIQIDVDDSEKVLSVTHMQMSADVPVGLAFNLIQYAGFGMMLAASLGYVFKEYVHMIIDAHIYECQYEAVETLLSREPRTLPTVELNAVKEKIQDYRITDFIVADYNPHPGMRIDTPV